MTDFSHLHTLEERAVRIRERMIDVQKNAAQWKAQATQLFQTEKEIADERTFLGLEDMDADKLYAELLDDHESEVVKEVTAIANAAEQAEQIRAAAEAVIEHFYNFQNCECGVPVSLHGNLTSCCLSSNGSAELSALKGALSRGWLSRNKPALEEK